MHVVLVGQAPYLAKCIHPVVSLDCQPGLWYSEAATFVKYFAAANFDECQFSYAGPAAWHSWPTDLLSITDTAIFK
jgi:hypothetical protein